jgi:hypothetical protein
MKWLGHVRFFRLGEGQKKGNGTMPLKKHGGGIVGQRE